MKNFLRQVFSPILAFFESGDEAYTYKPLNRKILIFISLLFLMLAVLVAWFSHLNQASGYWLPVVVFAAIACVGLVVGLLGSDRAVAKIWGSGRR